MELTKQLKRHIEPFEGMVAKEGIVGIVLYVLSILSFSDHICACRLHSGSQRLLNSVSLLLKLESLEYPCRNI